MKIQEVLTKTTQFFKEKKIETARLDAELLIAKALGLRRIDLYMKFEQPLKEPEVVQCREYVRRRAAGEPVAYILNEKGFFGLDFFVDRRVLIPRPESEMLVEAALDELQNRRPQARKANRSASAEDLAAAQAVMAQAIDVDTGAQATLPPAPVGEAPEDFRIIDLGCGSGCLALSILSRRPDTHATLVDLSPETLAVARMNAERLQVADRCEWNQGRVQDLDVIETADVIVANPPYIRPGDPALDKNVEAFEPAQALFGGTTGMEQIEQWLPVAHRALKPGGLLVMEIGADQGARTLAEFEKNHFVECRIRKDLSGHDRMVTGRKGTLHG